MHSMLATSVAILAGISSMPAEAYKEETHRDIANYAFELMKVAGQERLQNAFVNDATMSQFLRDLQGAASRLERLPTDLDPPHRDNCVDPEVTKRFPLHPPLSTEVKKTMGLFPVPVDVQYYTSENSCGVDPYWHPGTWYQASFPNEPMHAGNVLGFWATYPDSLTDDIRIGYKITNGPGLSNLKQAIEAAGGAALGTVWIPLRCTLKCATSIIELQLQECRACVVQAVEESKKTPHDVVATLGELGPVLGQVKSPYLTGMSHHIDMKSEVSAPGWKPFSTRRYDERPGMYTATAGPFGKPGVIEQAAILLSLYGVTVNYLESDAPKNYEVTDGNDFHPNSTDRDRGDWEYLVWPMIPFTPLDNLGWYGWSNFKHSVQAHRQDDTQPIRTRYLGWVLHALGDATVPMHVTSTFAWGHQPYEEAVKDQSREMLGGGSLGTEFEQGKQVLLLAKEYHDFIQSWRHEHPDHGDDIPVRDLVTALAEETYQAAMARPEVFNDALSVLALGNAAGASQPYKVHAGFFRQHMLNSTAATIAVLLNVAEILP